MNSTTSCLTFPLLMVTVYVLLLTSADGQSIGSSSTETSKDARQLVWPLYFRHLANTHPLDALPQTPSRLINMPMIKQVSPLGVPINSRQFYGVVNIYRPTDEDPLSPTNPDCKVCEKCPAPCPATIYPSPAISFTFENTTICTGTVANPYGPCTRVSAAPSGNFIVTWMVAGSATAFNSAFIGVKPICPNTKVTLTCENIPKGVSVATQTKSLSTGAVVVPSPTAVTETDFMQIIIANTGVTDVFAIVKCNWNASP